MIYLPDLIWHKIKEYLFGEIINIKSWYYLQYFRNVVKKNLLIKNIPNLLTCSRRHKKIEINNKLKNIYYQKFIIWRYLKNNKGMKYMKKFSMKIVSIK
jgi:dolichol kinase